MFISPLAKRLAAEKGIDYSQIAGTGFNGRIVAAVETGEFDFLVKVGV